MKRVVPKESKVDCLPSSLSGAQSETSGGYRRVQTSAAMLGLALSFGASAPLLTEPELALAADGPYLTVLPAADRDDQSPKLAVGEVVGASAAYHTIEPGESLWQIAAEHRADVKAIKAANGIVSDDVLRVGQVIRVPAAGADSSTAADTQDLAFKPKVSGGVGGDLTAVDGEPSSNIPSVDELEKTWALDGTLSLEDDDKLSEDALADSDLDQLSPDDVAVEDQAEIPETTSVTVDDEAVVSDASNSWVVADSQGAKPGSQQVARAVEEADASQAAAEAQVAAEDAQTAPLQASLPLNDSEAVPVASGQNSPSADQQSSLQAADGKKDLALAALSLRQSSPDSAVDSAALRSYQVKPGDTLWSIASSNGVTLDELLNHNHGVDIPEALLVGDSISIPVASAAVPEASVAVEEANADQAIGLSANTVGAPRTREQVISDHLARIRESNSTLVDRDELNARIRKARQELERSRTSGADQSAVSLEYHSPQPVVTPDAVGGNVEPASATALEVREGAQTPDSQWTVTDAAKDEPQTVAALGSVVEPAADASMQPAQEDAAQSAPAPVPSQLLAAAPLGADAYRAAPNMPVGQTVAPGMPMMPGADEFLPEAPRLSNGFIWPTHGTLTSGYGWRWGRMHRGVDIAGPVGTPVVAAAPGVVVSSGWNSGGYGNMVDIRHADGSMTRYAHNSRLLVRAGQQVNQGQQISEMGSTGYSTGPHLHFEIHQPSSGAVNPMAFLPAR